MEGARARCARAGKQTTERSPWKLLAVDGDRWPDFRSDRLRRAAGGCPARKPQQHPSARGQRRHRPRQDRRPVVAQDRPLAVAAALPCGADRPADRRRRQAHLLRHHVRECQRPGRRSQCLPMRSAVGSSDLAGARQDRHWSRDRQRARCRSDAVARRSMPSLAPSASHYNYQNAVWPCLMRANRTARSCPSYAAKLADVPAVERTDVHRSIIRSIPTRSRRFRPRTSSTGAFSQQQFAGKDVIIGVTTDAIGDQYFIPGMGQDGRRLRPDPRRRDAASQARRSASAGSLPSARARACGACAHFARMPIQQTAILFATALALLFGPALLEANLMFVDITPGPVRGDLLSRRCLPGGASGCAAWSIRSRACPISMRCAPTAAGATRR